MGKKFPTFSREQEINQLAMAFVRQVFAHWVVQEQEPNYHEDYVMERVDGGELSGLKLSVQLKGHGSMPFKDGFWTESMKTKHLRYYSEKARVPVYLFAVDVAKSTGYFLFLQEWLDTNVEPERLANRIKIPIKVPIGNRLDAPDLFLNDVKRALEYMAKRHPGSIDDAIAGEVRRIEAADPRWSVNVDVVAGKRCVSFNAKEPVKAGFRVPAEHVARFTDLVKYGRPLKVSGQGFEIDGLPAIAALGKGLQIASISGRPAHLQPLELNLWCDPPSDVQLQLRGEAGRGTAGVTFRGELGRSPLSAEILWRSGMVRGEEPGGLSLQFDFARWRGKPLRTLPYFRQVCALARALGERRALRFELLEEGNRVAAGVTGTPQDTMPFDFAAAVVTLTETAHDVATRLNLQLTFPDVAKLSLQDYRNVFFAHELLSRGRVALAGRVEIGLTLRRTDASVKNLLEMETAARAGEACGYTDQNASSDIFGTRVALGAIEGTIQPFTVECLPEERAAFLEGRLDHLNLRLGGTVPVVERLAYSSPS